VIDESKEVLELDVLELKNTNPYMIALIHDEQNRELPMPLGKSGYEESMIELIKFQR
jgi:hypothetical protein